ncbi:hypothetical protein H6501_02560 [Candidatus Woesearchaeota archaeon]|nr:hypothetical protein [Nanoarchaeota archaeon]MCB9370453.1 hypothetical protein [Candidatus Woesearchaeota archaeon]USN43531.1 MAG: hypothetical protein H6500_04000 [Candidatus Woesearchaeota archaeon]
MKKQLVSLIGVLSLSSGISLAAEQTEIQSQYVAEVASLLGELVSTKNTCFEERTKNGAPYILCSSKCGNYSVRVTFPWDAGESVLTLTQETPEKTVRLTDTFIFGGPSSPALKELGNFDRSPEGETYRYWGKSSFNVLPESPQIRMAFHKDGITISKEFRSCLREEWEKRNFETVAGPYHPAG